MPKNDELLQQLYEAAVEIWEEIELSMIKNLVGSIRRRLAAVIAAYGWYTKY
jgi:hypothetical protein